MRLLRVAFAFLAAGLSFTNALATPKIMRRSPQPEVVEETYYLVDDTLFSNHLSWTFTGDSLPDGLVASTYGVGDPNITHVFEESNVYVEDGYLKLLVNGGQTSFPYKSAQISTEVTNIKYASVRTVAILSQNAGVCNGMFFYKSDNQETDIEWLSDADSRSNDGTRKLWFTNQATSSNKTAKSVSVLPPTDVTSAEHEYRLDWIEGVVRWFVDGVQVAEQTQNVPSHAGPWLWNNWANGNKGWSVGPPAEDAVFRIREIDMYYNTA